MRRIQFLIAGLLLVTRSFAQQEVNQTFDDTRIVNGHSVETNRIGTMKFIIAHRFGAINSGAQNAWGLDNATMRIGLDYGIMDKLTIGIGRSTYEKTVDGYLKYRVLTQSAGSNSMPISLAVLGSSAWKTLKVEGSPESFPQRLSYVSQLLISRKFTDRFSVQLMPTYVHRNRVEYYEVNDMYSLGSAGQFHVSKNVSMSVEYYFTPKTFFPKKSETGGELVYNNQSLGLGVQLDTKGHVFQFHLSNSRGMVEKFFVAETKDQWLKGGIFFGFNITRDFKVAGTNGK
jgi:hypothetical protein